MIVFLGIGGLLALIAISFVIRNFWIIAIILACVGIYIYAQDMSTSTPGDSNKLTMTNNQAQFISEGSSEKRYRFKLSGNLTNANTLPLKSFQAKARLFLCQQDGDESKCVQGGEVDFSDRTGIPVGQIRQFSDYVTFENVPMMTYEEWRVQLDIVGATLEKS